MRIQPVILSGGAGTRLWPMSRKARPKQFLTFFGKNTLFQDTVLRATAPNYAPPIVIGAAAHADLVERQLFDIGLTCRASVLEPFPRNTAAAAAIAAAVTQELEPNALVLLMPSDHQVADAIAFRRAVSDGAGAAAAGNIVTLGVKPTEPHTGYGYIERGEPLSANVFRVRKFHEKPKLDAARAYLEGGAHFWNAGLFLFAPSAMSAEFKAHAPEILSKASGALVAARTDGRRRIIDPTIFGECPSDSIDFAVMEKTEKAAVVGPLDAGWSDVGAWTSAPVAADAKVFTLDSEGAVVRSDGPFIGVIGAPDIVVVATGDAVLVAPKSRVQEVKRIVEELTARGRHDLL